jgi:hypothetical protein
MWSRKTGPARQCFGYERHENPEVVKPINSLVNFDALYPQPNGELATQQLQIQLSNPLPYDLEETKLAEYKNLAKKGSTHSIVHSG